MTAQAAADEWEAWVEDVVVALTGSPCPSPGAAPAPNAPTAGMIPGMLPPAMESCLARFPTGLQYPPARESVAPQPSPPPPPAMESTVAAGQGLKPSPAMEPVEAPQAEPPRHLQGTMPQLMESLL